MGDATELLERAVQQTAAIVKGVKAEQLESPSPCEEWDTRAVINHTIGALFMFRDAITKGEADLSVFSTDLVGGDAASSFDSAAVEVLDQFRRPGALDGTINLPFGEFPAPFAITLLTNDVTVHGWDIARATGQIVRFDDEVTEACTQFSKQALGRSGLPR